MRGKRPHPWGREPLWGPVVISQAAVTKSPKLGSLQQQRFVFHSLEAQSPKSKWQQGPAPSEASRGGSCPGFLASLVAPRVPGHVV